MDSPSITSQPTGTILLVDDDPVNLDILARLLRPYYEVLAAPSGERALEVVAGPAKPDLILLDVLMPGMNGYGVLARLREDPATRDIPVIFVTGLDSTADEERGLELGAVDYITKPYRASIILARVHTQLELRRARQWLANQVVYLEAEVARRTQDIQLAQDITIRALAELAETRDSETGNHIRRTQEYMHILAKRLQSHPRFSAFLTDKVVELLTKSAPLHDIGKVGIPDQILLKPGKLTAEEWRIMKTHCLLGADAIERAVHEANHSVDFLDMAQQIAHYHHEKWDGSGYPEGRQADAIPVPARLMALADAFDAIVSLRSYKRPVPAEKAKELIARERGHQFDPDMVDAFLASYPDFVAAAQRYNQQHDV
ncbi:MAG: response regulator receiver modulated metal dependent phosphohydrolase [Rhodocyclaceae bacterium]|nr:response regulator receiver modulated metal dependent phosphohydrolase [Rhodocyclaceae bacterium]